jgi:hypothetical protein
VDSPANSAAYGQAGNRYVEAKQYEETTNSHGFLKYYTYFVRKPGEGL